MVYFELRGDELQNAHKAKQMVFARAQESLAINDIELRDLRPEDIEMTNPAFTYDVTATSGWATLINDLTIENQRWITIYGISYKESSPLFTSVRMTAGGAKKMDRPVDMCSGLQDKSIFFAPVMIDQLTNLKIDAYNNGTTTNPSESMVFWGYVAEKKGKVLAP